MGYAGEEQITLYRAHAAVLRWVGHELPPDTTKQEMALMFHLLHG